MDNGQQVPVSYTHCDTQFDANFVYLLLENLNVDTTVHMLHLINKVYWLYFVHHFNTYFKAIIIIFRNCGFSTC